MSGYLDILIFAGVAAFLIYRLVTVLGRTNGNEPGQTDTFRDDAGAGPDSGKVIQMPRRGRHDGANDGIEMDEESQTELGKGLRAIQEHDPNFSGEEFAHGAKSAFEMIITAYASGDKETLRPLLVDDVFRNFTAAIDDREENGENLDLTLVGLNSAEIVGAEVQGKAAFVTLQFISEQINVIRDGEGRIVEGDPNAVEEITDLWTFTRNTKSRDPNWKLVATETP